MEILVYAARCLFMLLVTWAGIRLIGKKSIAQMTTYDLSAVFLLTTVASEPLVFKVPSKATVGVAVITAAAVFLGWLSLRRVFYNVDKSPAIVVHQGQIRDDILRRNRMNIPLLLSELRIMGYQDLSDVAYAIIEPNGKLAVIPTADARPLTPRDMNIPVSPVNLAYPLILDGEVIGPNLTGHLHKDMKWLSEQLSKVNAGDPHQILIAQIDSGGKLYVNAKDDRRPDIPGTL